MMRGRQFASLMVCFVALTGCDVIEIAAQSERAQGTFERTLTVNGPVDLSVRTGSGNPDSNGHGRSDPDSRPNQRGFA